MKILETKAVVLSSLKYGETSLIIRCYTQDFGLKSFIAKGVFSKKKRNTSLYFPLTELELSFQPKANEQQLVFLRSAQTSYYYETLHFHPIKSAIVFFLAEILNLVLKEETDNSDLYFYIEHSLKEFDQKKEDFADFHLIFLIQLSHFLGFYPNLEMDGSLFDLENGFFTNSNSSINMLKADETALFKKLLEINFTENSKNTFNQPQRSLLLEILVKYYQIHTNNFKKPKSLQVLHELFS
ncbi:DNA repair protein RecO [Empedobacter brevis]|uniref:DNA repair protein RecO n=1 Tax=Empedobacter brevis TaxID=247 RepID=UPI00289638B0|nr:DNA repair protein RecO [Empedobacter brevis]